MIPNINKVLWTQEKLDEWEKRQREVNTEYRKASNIQLEEWVKGNSTHNHINPINAIVDDDDGKVVGYFQSEGGECCPDFSCCGGTGWPLEKRQKFLELHKSGNIDARDTMLLGALADLATTTNKEVYMAGQFSDDSETKH